MTMMTTMKVCTNQLMRPMNDKIIDYTEEVTVTLTRSDWNWFVTLMTDSVNKMELAVETAGKDSAEFLAIETLRTIRNEIAQQSGLDQFIERDAD